MAASTKMAVFYRVAQCGLVEVTDVSEVLDASIIKVVSKQQRLEDGGSKHL
jgi:hypothetical protein